GGQVAQAAARDGFAALVPRQAMISRAAAEFWSPAMGAAGGLLLAVPFFADYFSRGRRTGRLGFFKAPEVSKKDAATLEPSVRNAETERVLAAEPWMALLAGIGCLLLAA